MALYEYRCTTCDTRFEERRAMADADAPATCPDGHPARRLLSVFATVGGDPKGASSSGPAAMPAGGCGAGCACAH